MQQKQQQDLQHHSQHSLQPHIKAHFDKVLHHLYINPLEKCNLKCKICYTRKTGPILSAAQILDFIQRYEAVQEVKTVTFCGGEVFALAYFPQLVNTLTDLGIFVQVITNGTIDKLDEFTTPNFMNLITSLDGVEEYHDKNRGEGNYRKSINFMKKAYKLGFHLDVFSIVTHQNLQTIDVFEAKLKEELGFLPMITFHPRKPPTYLTVHPVSNIVGETDGFDFLTTAEMLDLMKTRNVFPPKELGCYQVALSSDGKVYGCCEGTLPLGVMTDTPEYLIQQLYARLQKWELVSSGLTHCLGCSQPDFVCGIKKYLQELAV
jgi:MoaA/NifB/PqqE/SkfB family radical SAM enzyme